MKSVTGILAALAVFAAGYGLARLTAPDAPPLTPPRPQVPVVAVEPGTSLEDAELVAGLQAALAQPTALGRTLRSSQILSSLAPANLGVAPELFETARKSAPIAELVIDAWARLDGQAAFDHIQAIGGMVAQDRLPGLFEGWAYVDPQAALQAFEGLPPNDAPVGPAAKIRNALTGGFVRGWARSGQPGLLEFLYRQQHGSELSGWLAFVLRERVGRDGAASVRRWLDELTSDEDLALHFRRMVADRGAKALGEADGQGSVSWAEGYAGTPFAGSVFSGLASSWVLVNGAATMEWLAGLPTIQERRRAIDVAYRTWIAAQPEAAMAWAAAADPEVIWEPVIKRYAEVVARTNPREALSLADRITNSQLRDKCLIEIGRIWYAAEPGPATAWLEASHLDEKQRAKVTASKTAKGRKRSGTPKPGMIKR